MSIEIELKPLRHDQLGEFWQLAYSNPHAEWAKWNGPYFRDEMPTRREFVEDIGINEFEDNPNRQIIWANGRMVGMVSAYFDDGALLRWLDVGITIYDDSMWGKGIGTASLELWITHLFTRIDLPHIGLTTWSGNKRMMTLAEKLDMTLEARVRQVRYWQGKYWDSVKYGVLRDEWFAKHGQN